MVKASFTRGDFAFDWVKRYLEDQKVWDNSRVFMVTACNPLRRGIPPTNTAVSKNDPNELLDGLPHPIYEPAVREPELFHWKNHWISINSGLDGGMGHDGVQVLTLRCVFTSWHFTSIC